MNFITAEDLCAFAGKVPAEGDPLPAQYCRAGMEAVADYLGYNPESVERTETVKGDGGALAALSAMPITAMTALSVDGEEADASALEVQSDNYICFKDGSAFAKGSRYEVSYKAGWEDVPDLIKTAALQIASLLWESAGGNLAVSSTSFADTGSRVFNNFTAERFLKQLAKWKRTL